MNNQDNNQMNQQMNQQVNNQINQQMNNQMNQQINQQVNHDNQINVQIKNNEREGRGLFYGIIAVAVFVIMAVGATFAYFTATTSSAEGAAQAGSTSLKLRYISYNNAWNNKDLIPAEQNVVEYSFELQDDTTINTRQGNKVEDLKNGLCKDDDGNSICSVYVFQVENTAKSAQTLEINLKSDDNGFKNLKGMMYQLSIDNRGNYELSDENNGITDPQLIKTSDLSEDYPEYDPETSSLDDYVTVTASDGESSEFVQVFYRENTFPLVGNNKFYYTPIYVNRNGVRKKLLKYAPDRSNQDVRVPSIGLTIPETGAPAILLADKIEINGLTTETFALVLYIQNIDEDQKDDEGKTFSGTISIDKGNGSSGVSGQINAASKDNLASADKKLQSEMTDEEQEEANPTPTTPSEENPEETVEP